MSEDPTLRRWTAALLRAGVLAATATLVLGLVVQFARDPGAYAARYARYGLGAARMPSGVETLKRLPSGDPSAILLLGLLLLTAVPLARVGLSLVGFLRARDWLYVALTVVVLALLVTGVVLGRVG
jgi:uncharacterized membrane protein